MTISLVYAHAKLNRKKKKVSSFLCVALEEYEKRKRRQSDGWDWNV